MKIIENFITSISNEGTEMKYIYSIIEGNYNGGEAYGIEVERQDIKNGQPINVKKDNIKLISNNRDKVYELLKLLYKNQVSPIHLIEILGEYVDEYIYDFKEKEIQLL
ncbi:MAG: DUF6514 family protein [Clostridium sp.]